MAAVARQSQADGESEGHENAAELTLHSAQDMVI